MAAVDRGRRRLRFGKVNWEVRAGIEDLLGPLLQNLGEQESEAAESGRITAHKGKRLFMVKTGQPGLPGELMVQTYRARGLSRLLSGLKKSTRTSREWRMAMEHERRGLPVAPHLARGVRWRGLILEEEFLIQESLTGFEAFDEFFRTTFRPELPGVGPADKRRLIQNLAELIRRMHDQGISRPGLAPKNILATSRAGSGARFVFTDLALSSLPHGGRPLTREERIRELAHFHESFSPLFSQSYRLRFYREYFSGEGLSPSEFQAEVREIVDLSGDLAKKEEGRIIQAVFRRKSPYFWFDTAEHRVFLIQPLYQNSLLEVMAKLKVGESPGLMRVKRVKGGAPLELDVVQLGREDLADKAARWGFLLSAIMTHHGIQHFRVWAAVENHQDRAGWLFCAMPGRGEYNLAEYLARRVAEEFSGLSWDRKFLIRVARFILRLHDLGWHFPRPAGDDLWVRFTDAGTHEILLGNLHRLEPITSPDPEIYLKNLIDLWRVLPISQSDGLMLADEYLKLSRQFYEDRAAWRKLFREWQLEEIPRPEPEEE